MMEFTLNEENLRKAWNKSSQYWFSVKEFVLYNTEEMELYNRPDGMSQSEYFVSLGMIPYFSVTSIEVMRSFISTINNKKLVAAMQKVSDADFEETFWKYYNAYKELSSYDDYETEYVKSKAIKWCEENSIPYKLK